MTYLIILIGVFFIIVGAVLLVRPEIFLGFFRKHLESLGLQVIVVSLNLTIGVSLCSYASISKFPDVFMVFGAMAILKGTINAIIGRSNFKKRVSWGLDVIAPIGRAIGVMYVTFGAFLIHTVW